MTDQEKADLLLDAYYARRKSGGKVRLEPSDLREIPEKEMPEDEIVRLSERLDAEDLIYFDPVTDEAGQVVTYGGEIAPKGTRKVEGEERLGAGATHVDSRDYNISGAQNVQAGDHNTQEISANLRDLALQINGSDATEEEKQEAANLLSTFLRHPAVVAAMGGASGQVADYVEGLL
jgi:hypothetical protein